MFCWLNALLIECVVDWMRCWLNVLLSACVVDWMRCWLNTLLVECVVDWMHCWSNALLIKCIVDWMHCWLNVLLIKCIFDWMRCWMNALLNMNKHIFYLDQLVKATKHISKDFTEKWWFYFAMNQTLSGAVWFFSGVHSLTSYHVRE